MLVVTPNSPIQYLPAEYPPIGVRCDQRVQITILPDNKCIEFVYDPEGEFAICDFSSQTPAFRFTDPLVTLREALRLLAYASHHITLTYCDIPDANIDNILDTPIRDIPLSQMNMYTVAQEIIDATSNITYSNGTYESITSLTINTD
jgi:hypothetical protein